MVLKSNEIELPPEKKKRPSSWFSKITEKDEGEVFCSICYNELHDPQLLDCGYTFCKECI